MSSSINTALFWKCWKLSAKPFLVSQAVVISVSALAIATIADPATTESGDIIANAVTFLGLLILFGMMTSNSVKESKHRFSIGFPFVQEFVLPIPTMNLVAIPVIYYCMLLSVAYSFPLTVLSFVLGIDGPQLVILLIVILTVIAYMSLAWFSKSVISQIAAWLTIVFLYYSGWVFPEMEVENNSVRIVSWQLESFIVPFVISAGFFCLLYLGVVKQRVGEDLLGVSQDTKLIDLSSGGKTSIFGSEGDCPTNTPLKAQLWRENRLRGPHFSIAAGASVGLLALILARTIVVLANPVEPWDAEKMGVLCTGMYFMYFAIIHAQSYGIRFKHGAGSISLFDKLVPMSTAQLNFLQVGTLLFSSLVGAIAMFITIALLGDFFLSDFSTIRSTWFAELQSYFSQPLQYSLIGIIVFATNFSIASIMFSVLNAWSVINQSLVLKLIIGFSVYVFLLVSAVYMMTELADFNAVIGAVFLGHLWIPIVAAPIASFILYRYCLTENILNSRQLLSIILCSAVLWIAAIVGFLINDSYSDLESMTAIVGMSLWGGAPLLAIGLSLFTLSKIRHGY